MATFCATIMDVYHFGDICVGSKEEKNLHKEVENVHAKVIGEEIISTKQHLFEVLPSLKKQSKGENTLFVTKLIHSRKAFLPGKMDRGFAASESLTPLQSLGSLGASKGDTRQAVILEELLWRTCCRRRRSSRQW